MRYSIDYFSNEPIDYRNTDDEIPQAIDIKSFLFSNDDVDILTYNIHEKLQRLKRDFHPAKIKALTVTASQYLMLKTFVTYSEDSYCLGRHPIKMKDNCREISIFGISVVPQYDGFILDPVNSINYAFKEPGITINSSPKDIANYGF